VRAVQIPKPHGGGIRLLGVPTVADRVAQTVVARRLGVRVEQVFHPDSYGYRPNKSALDAVARCRTRCWSHDWVIDLDVAKFFDTVAWDLVEKAVAAHTDEKWVLLYVKRWLRAPLQQPDGTLVQRSEGTPQGSAVSPVLANLFLHYAFDAWMDREFPGVVFERYADDAVVHCRSQQQARAVLEAIRNRMVEVGLTLHPEKTRIVYCQDSNRRERHPTTGGPEVRVHTSFTFLGFTFRGRKVKGKHGGSFTGFTPAISDDAWKRISREVHDWRLHRRTNATFAQLAAWINPRVAGWMRYYGAFHRSALNSLLARINSYLVRWIRKKYKHLSGLRKALRKLTEITNRRPRMFAHWAWVRHTLGPG
jgi:group II intron reverse transcriptase/maturase